MADDRHENRMHGNPEMHGGHENRGDGGLSAWGHPEQQGRDHAGYSNPARFDQHGGQSGQGGHQGAGGMSQGGSMGGSYYQGDQHQMGGQPQQHHGFDQQRYGQQGQGSWGGRDHPQSWGEAQDAHPDHHDHQYRNWRDQQMQAFDREYDEFRRHRQERFNSDFEEWRKSRSGSGSALSGQGPGEQISTTQRPGGSDEKR